MGAMKPRLVFETPTHIKNDADSMCAQPSTVYTPQTNGTPMMQSIPATNLSGIREDECAPPAEVNVDSPIVKENDNNASRSETVKTPAPFSMNKFVPCFKSEPNLSKALTDRNDNVSILNRGRFIAKKLLGGVSMVNLGFPFGSNAHEKKPIGEFTPTSTRATVFADRINEPGGAIKKINFENDANADDSNNKNEPVADHLLNNIDDSDDDVDFDEKENLPDVECDEPSYLEKVKQAYSMQCGSSGGGTIVTTIGCLPRDNVSMSDSMIGDSVSPITKSTHRMSKAMQVSRKSKQA